MAIRKRGNFKNFFSITTIIFFCFLLLPTNVSAVVSSSGNYKVYGGQTTVFSGKENSSNYQTQIAGGNISGRVNSANYQARPGSSFTLTILGGGNILSQITKSNPPTVNRPWIQESTTPNKIKIIFDTDKLSAGYLQYGQNNLYNQKTFEEISFGTSHDFVLDNLDPNAIYNFIIHLRDTNGNYYQSIPFNFSLGDGFSKSVGEGEAGLKIVPAMGKMKLFWDLDSADKVKIFRGETDFPSGQDQSEIVFEGRGESFTDEGVEMAKNYFYRVFFYDKQGNLINEKQIGGNSSESSIQTEKIKTRTPTPQGEQYFTVDLDLDSSQVEKLFDLTTRVSFSSKANVEPAPAMVSFQIVDGEGRQVYGEAEDVVAEQGKIIWKQFPDLPLEPAHYVLKLSVAYGGAVENRLSRDFKIIGTTAPSLPKSFWWRVLFLTALLSIGFFALQRMEKTSKKRGRPRGKTRRNVVGRQRKIVV